MTEEKKEYPHADLVLRKKFLDDFPAHPQELRPAEIQTLGKFKILQKIGKGAAADVYLAEDTLVNRRVALKVLTRFHPQDFERFKRESKVAAKLNHPNIVQLYEVGELESLNYISMQYIEGGSVADRNLTLVQALKIISTIARSVEYAHNQGVIHRDIKPANILLDHEGKSYLADFGIAKSLTLQTVGKTISVTGMIIGTPNFMSPEQARGDLSKVDFLSDVYSLGATLYYLLTGKEPYQGTSVMEIINKVINEDAPPPRSIKKDIPQEVEAIVLKTIEKDGTRRYQRSVELAKDIERFLRGEPVEAKVTSLATKTYKRLKKYKTSIITGIVILALISYFGISILIQQNKFKSYKSVADEYFAKGELDLAYEYYMKCLGIKEDSEVRLRITSINDKKQRQSKAQGALDKALTLYDRYKKIIYDKTATVEQIRETISELIKHLNESIQNYPLASAYYHRGKIHRGLVEFEDAEKDLTEAIKLDKKFDLARLERIKLRWDMVTTSEMYSVPTHKAADAYKAFSDRVRNEIEEINLDNLPKYEGEIGKFISIISGILGNDYESDDYYHDILRQLELAYEKSRDEEFYYLIGVLHTVTLDYEKKIEYLAKAIEKKPFFPKAYFLKGKTSAKLERFEQAINDYTNAIRQVPHYVVAYLERARAYSSIAEYEKAILDCKKALEVSGTSYDYIAYEILGEIYLRKDLLDDALEYFNKSLSINSKWLNSLITRAMVYIKKNEAINALEDLNNAINIDPDGPRPYFHRGVLYLLNMKEYKLALDDFNKAMEIRKFYKIYYVIEDLYLFRGIAYFNLGEYDRALNDLNEAIKIDPSLEKQARPYLDKIKDQKPDK